MLADATTTVWILVAFAFTAATLAWVLYALVRPFTHRDYRRRARLWQPLD